jgi:hypothetical protein
MTIDPNTGAGTWSPGKADAGPTSVTVSETNSAGKSYLTFNFPTYFTTAPTNVVLSFYSSAPNTPSSALTTVVTWAAPSDTVGITDYKITVTSAATGASTTYDTQSTNRSFTLTGLPTGQSWVTVTAYDANGNPGITSASAPLYLAALPAIGWTFSQPNAIAGEPLSIQFTNFNGSYPYAIVSGPAAATINATTGLLSWTPSLSDVGTVTLVVSATTGWGTEYLTLKFPVYFTDAPSAVSVQTGTDANGNTTWTASWASPTMNTGSIMSYKITFFDASLPAGSPPTILTVPASQLSVVLSNLPTLHGSVQVAAVDAFGDLGVASPLFTF